MIINQQISRVYIRKTGRLFHKMNMYVIKALEANLGIWKLAILRCMYCVLAIRKSLEAIKVVSFQTEQYAKFWEGLIR